MIRWRRQRLCGLFLPVALAALPGCAQAQARADVAAPATPPSEASIAAALGDTAGPPSASVFVGCGFLLIQNHGRTSFTVLLRGEHAVQFPLQDQTVFDLDEVLVETTTASAELVGAPAARGEELLRRHMEWEAAWTARQNGWTGFRPTSAPLDLGTGIPAMLWGYDMPTPLRVMGESVTSVMYLTAAVEDVVFVLAAPLRPGDDPARVSRTLHDGVLTLRKSPWPVDPVAFSRQLQAARQPWDGCRDRGRR
jgi:hypothetical protein